LGIYPINRASRELHRDSKGKMLTKERENKSFDLSGIKVQVFSCSMVPKSDNRPFEDHLKDA